MYLNDHMSGKDLFIRFTARAFRKLLSIYAFLVLRAEYGIWLYQVLIIAYLLLYNSYETCFLLWLASQHVDVSVNLVLNS